MVGLQVLVLAIGVRIPVPEHPTKNKLLACFLYFKQVDMVLGGGRCQAIELLRTT